MGIKLDWQVESEQTHLRATEDPESKYRRARARRQLLLLIVGLACLLAVVAGLVIWRLRGVENQYRQDLIDTVNIEVTALRLGDFANYMAIQRSASDAFMLEQSRRFEDYQQLKQTHRVRLSGDVLDVEIDDLRGRVVVEEIIDDVPYAVVWFYWYYEDPGQGNQGGWRHVPDDLTFWGDEDEIVAGPVQIHYHDLDSELAETLAPLAQDWWTRGCVLLECRMSPPDLRINIVAERPTTVEWEIVNPWTLRITSPLVGRSRADLPISPELERAISQQFAARLVRYAAGDVPAAATTDSAWLHMDIARWLDQALITHVPDGDPGFTGTLIAQAGPGAPGSVLRLSQAGTTLDEMLSPVLGVSLSLLSVEQLNALNWQPFFQWRLDLEARLLAEAQNGDPFLALYDLENLSANDSAAQRAVSPDYAARPVPQVGVVAITRDANNQTYAYVETTRTESGVAISETIIWRLAGGTWKRAS